MIPSAILIVLGTFILSGNANTTTQSLCPQELLKIRDNYFIETNKACFRFAANMKQSYWYARSQCRRSGGKLASITSTKENYFIIRKLQQMEVHNKFWIGMYNSQQTKGREFTWEDKSPVKFTFWANSQGLKDKSKLSCVFLDSSLENNGRWFDTSCGCKQQCPGFVCKYTSKPTSARNVQQKSGLNDASTVVTTSARPAVTSDASSARTTAASTAVTTSARSAVTSDASSARTTAASTAVTTSSRPAVTSDASSARTTAASTAVTTSARPAVTSDASSARTTAASTAVTTSARPAVTSDASSARTTAASTAVTTSARSAVTSDASSARTTVAYTSARSAVTTDSTPDVTTITTPTTTATVLEVDSNLIITNVCSFFCPDLDCGMNGFKIADNGCQICECNE